MLDITEPDLITYMKKFNLRRCKVQLDTGSEHIVELVDSELFISGISTHHWKPITRYEPHTEPDDEVIIAENDLYFRWNDMITEFEALSEILKKDMDNWHHDAYKAYYMSDIQRTLNRVRDNLYWLQDRADKARKNDF